MIQMRLLSCLVVVCSLWTAEGGTTSTTTTTATTVTTTEDLTTPAVCDSVLTSIYPVSGPQSGATNVTLTGTSLDLVGEVIFGDTPVPINIISSTMATVLSPAANVVTSVFIRLNCTDGTVLSSAQSFRYRPELNITYIWPLRTFISGGINITVTGVGFDAVTNPRLVITITRAGFITEVERSCRVWSSTSMTCPIPALPPGDHYYLGIILDSDDTYRNLTAVLPPFSELTVYDGPNFSCNGSLIKFKYAIGSSQISIAGENLTLGAHPGDYRVMVGAEECRYVQVISPLLTCSPPPTLPAKSTIRPNNSWILVGGDAPNPENIRSVMIYIGDELVNDQCVVEYLADLDSSVPSLAMLIAAPIAAVVLLIAVICAIFCCTNGYCQSARADENDRHLIYKDNTSHRDSNISHVTNVPSQGFNKYGQTGSVMVPYQKAFTSGHIPYHTSVNYGYMKPLFYDESAIGSGYPIGPYRYNSRIYN